MKKSIFPILLLAMLFLSACGEGEDEHDDFQESSEKTANIVFAEEFIRFVSEGNYNKATEYYAEETKEKLPASELEQIWLSLEDEYGSFVNQEYNKTEKQGDHDVVSIIGEFEQGEVVFLLTINQDEKIVDFTYDK